MAAATIKDVSDYFKTGDPDRDKLGNFKNEWTALTDKDKAEIKQGLGDGTLTY